MKMIAAHGIRRPLSASEKKGFFVPVCGSRAGARRWIEKKSRIEILERA